MKKTTINMHVSTYVGLKNLSKKMGCSCSQLIKCVLHMLARDSKKRVITYSTVKYQDRSEAEKWHTFHITFMPAEYELYFDLKKIYKFSLSLLVALALNKYSKELAEFEENSPGFIESDLFRLKAYSFRLQKSDNNPQIILSWGIATPAYRRRKRKKQDKKFLLEKRI